MNQDKKNLISKSKKQLLPLPLWFELNESTEAKRKERGLEVKNYFERKRM